ncbi:Fc.00g080720.m01.CDS01 [Cosmosporella sp. VM-42]
MLARQARRSFSLHQTTTRRSIGLSSRYPHLQQSAISTLGRRSVVTQQTRLWRRRGSESSHGLPHGRHLATAVDDFKFGNSPYNQLGDPGLPPFQSPSRLYNIRTFDPSSPLVIPEPTSSVPAPSKINTFGIPGDLEDLLPVFDACIQVGKLQRAALVLKRLNVYGMVSPEERIILHNRYLRASLDQMRMNPDRKQAEQLHKWYELQIRNQDMPQTAETIACMLKASLLSERGSRLQRLVNRYMGMAPGEAGLRVLGMDDILSDQDLAVITEICPTYNYTPEAEDFDTISLASDEQQAELLEAETSRNPAYPEVSVTPQRGEGLNTLKRALGLMMELQDVDISKLSPEEQEDFQTRLESDAIDSAIAKWRNIHKGLQKMGVNTALSANAEDGSLSQHLPSWLGGMEARLKVEMEKVEESENRAKKTQEDLERCVYGPFLRQANPTRLAAVTILTVLNVGALIGADRGVVVSRLVHDIARVAQEDIQTQIRDEKKKKERQRRKVQFIGDAAKARLNHQGPIIADADQPDTKAVPQEVEGDDMDQNNWSLLIKGQVGSILLKALIETAKVKVIKEHPVTRQLISQYQPAFSHLMQPRKGKKIGVLILNAELVERMKREPVGDFIAKHLPMVAQPKPWKSMHNGGFLASKSILVRTKPGDVEQKLYSKAAIQRGDMDQVLKALDVLGKTAWRINNNVLKVMLEAWNSGEEIANMPALHPDLELPTEPDASDDPMLRRDWTRAVKLVENERSGLHSQRCYMNLQLEIARAFRNQTVYFPHNVDYRGRAYPIPTYLNHMGADHTRAILKFSKGKELGASGLRWLKIHLSNLYGFDKASFDDREAFATENVANIIESATNPLKGSRWWLKAEDPWQCLAACFELKAALELPDPTKFVSQLPVHQDGTCNGLQHYAALGGDTWGAKQVNLEPGAKPADVYSAVANLVKDLIAKDVKADNPLAKVIDGKITRKVVKQTVMTNVYGVTFAGAKKQVLKQLDALYPDLHKEGFAPMLCATYIAKHIFTALGTMFRGAHDIQYWLGEAGGRICKSLTPAQIQQIANEYEEEQAASPGNKSRRKFKLATDELSQQFRSTLVWTTPLRMPVAQPYRKSSNREIHTCLQSISYPVSDQTDPVNRKKQLQGFPPNFIHSLDASHMLLSALQCDELGLNFAAVHDSFWTHAADVDTMNTVLRDAFIRIHEEDVVGRLLAEFEARYKGSLRLVNINPDSPMGQKIKEFRAKSKLNAKEELLLEYKRTQLRLSGNPWDLEAAEKIITPASVYEEMSALEVKEAELEEDAEHVALGVIPEGEAKLDATAIAKEIEQQVDQEMEEQDDADDMTTQTSSQFVDSLLENTIISHFEKNVIEQKQSKKSTRGKTPLAIWLPLSFPPIPEKGDFNVSRLRDSKYFFS